jgi:hypothetical protein
VTLNSVSPIWVSAYLSVIWSYNKLLIESTKIIGVKVFNPKIGKIHMEPSWVADFSYLSYGETELYMIGRSCPQG